MFFRLMLATTFAELIFSIVWVSVGMIGHISLEQFYTIIGSNFIMKIVFQAAATPFTYLTVSYLRKIDENELVIVKDSFNTATNEA